MMYRLQLHKCVTCKKRFRNSLDLSRHRRTHSAARPYSCRFTGCEKIFSSLSHLQQHIRQHTGERPYLCGQCGARFLQRHHLTRHKCQQSLSFTCTRCQLSFQQQCHLNRHLILKHKVPLRSRLKLKTSKVKTKMKTSRTQSSLYRMKSQSKKNENGQKVLLKIHAGTSMTILKPRDVSEQSDSKDAGSALVNHALSSMNKNTSPDDTLLTNHTKPRCISKGHSNSWNRKIKNLLSKPKDSRLLKRTSETKRRTLLKHQNVRHRNPRKQLLKCNANLLAGNQILRKYCRVLQRPRQLKKSKMLDKSSVACHIQEQTENDMSPIRNGIVFQKDKMGRITSARQLDSPRSETASACNSPQKEYSIVPCSNGSYSPGSLKVKLSPRKTVHLDVGVDSPCRSELTYTSSSRLVEEVEKRKRQPLSEDFDAYEVSPAQDHDKEYDAVMTCVSDSGVEILSSSSCNRSNGNSVQLDENSSSSHFNTEDSNMSLDSPAALSGFGVGHLPRSSSICDKCCGTIETNNNSLSPGKCVCVPTNSLVASVSSVTNMGVTVGTLTDEDDSLQQYFSESLDSIPIVSSDTVKHSPAEAAPDLYQQQFLSFLSKVEKSSTSGAEGESSGEKEKEETAIKRSPKTRREKRSRRKSSCPCCLGLSPKKRKHAHGSSEKRQKLPKNYKQFIKNTRKLLDLQEKLQQLLAVMLPECSDLICASKTGTDRFEGLLDEIMSSFEDENEPGVENSSKCELSEVSPLFPLLVNAQNDSKPCSSPSSCMETNSHDTVSKPDSANQWTKSDDREKTIGSCSEASPPHLVSALDDDGDDSDSNKTIDLDLEREVQLVRTKIARPGMFEDDSDEELLLDCQPPSTSKSSSHTNATPIAFNSFKFTNTGSSSKLQNVSSSSKKTSMSDRNSKSRDGDPDMKDSSSEAEFESVRVSLCKNPKTCLKQIQGKVCKLFKYILPDLDLPSSIFRNYDHLQHFLDLTILSNTPSSSSFDEQLNRIHVVQIKSKNSELHNTSADDSSDWSESKNEAVDTDLSTALSETGLSSESDVCSNSTKVSSSSVRTNNFAKGTTDCPLSDSPSHCFDEVKCSRQNGRHDETPEGFPIRKHDYFSNFEKHSTDNTSSSLPGKWTSSSNGWQGQPVVSDPVLEPPRHCDGAVTSADCMDQLLSPRRKSVDKNIFELLQPTHMGAALS